MREKMHIAYAGPLEKATFSKVDSANTSNDVPIRTHPLGQGIRRSLILNFSWPQLVTQSQECEQTFYISGGEAKLVPALKHARLEWETVSFNIVSDNDQVTISRSDLA